MKRNERRPKTVFPCLPGLAAGGLLLLAGLAAVACSAPDERAGTYLRQDDLLIDGMLSSDQRGVELAEVLCADEHRLSVPLADGEELSALVEVGPGAELTVAGCVGRPTGEEREAKFAQPRTVAIRVEAAGRAGGYDAGERAPESAAPVVEHAVELPHYRTRWSETVDLAGLPAGRARVRIEAEIPKGLELYLLDVALRRPAPAPPAPLPAPEGEKAAARQVLLISVDTLRPDALGSLGGEWPTPNLDRFAAGAEVWAPHYAGASWTKPSHASLLTGQSLVVHRATTQEGAIHPGVPLLAERFRAGGFLTAGLVTDVSWLNAKFGFGRGFDDYRSVRWTLPQMTRHASRWMIDHQDEPFFYFLHTFEVHSDFRRLPYEAPGVNTNTVEEMFGAKNYGCRDKRCASGLLRAMSRGLVEPLPREDEILAYLYGSGVTYLDSVLGDFFAELEAEGLLDNLLVVLTSDHGEMLLEHDETLHGVYWDETVRVPLLIKWPGGRFAGERRSEVTSALDVAPTLLTAAGLPTDGLPGADLRDLKGPRPIFNWGNWQTVVAEGWKAVLFPNPQNDLLFRLGEEDHDLAAEELERLRKMRKIGHARQKADVDLFEELDVLTQKDLSGTLSDEEVKRLKALGYLGGT